MASNAAANYITAKATANAQKRDVYVTGFGKFGDILDNPTTFLVQKLVEHQNVTEAHVLNVSAASCVKALADVYTRAEERGRPCIFLHFGVSSIACSLKLEQVGYNIADFQIPDEQGYVAKNEVIHKGEPNNISTQVPLEEMLMILKTIHPKVTISTDPGRYVCNYVYYRSLVWVKHHEVTKGGQSKHFALFVHVPKLDVMSFDHQITLASKIVDIVANI
ncbi:unnamed protein product [Peronospora belbahrii]|uniref:Uncharacterized protein n=1 Tax=Peronospora belbahrii TaxID=622444 RepID=A0AAU9L9W7_9STRA|nr:unnamed protein product [Peronospora belbahrii]CAH0513999.1 unnamed protein product [Peronospora belbahrii]